MKARHQARSSAKEALVPAPEFAPGELVPIQECRRWLRSCGQQVRIYRGARLAPAGLIAVGDYSQIDEGVRIFAGQGVTIGAHAHLAFESSISGGGGCAIGDFASVGAAVRLITGSDVVDGAGLTNPTIPPASRAVRRSHIDIGAHAVLFTGCVVLPGVTVGEGAVVAAGSIVHHDLKPWRIYAGTPLVQVGRRPRQAILQMAERLRLRQTHP